jgi:hypothetical protein
MKRHVHQLKIVERLDQNVKLTHVGRPDQHRIAHQRDHHGYTEIVDPHFSLGAHLMLAR